ncbi:protein kinase domain-containing protein (plasmid) [Nocardia sp. CA-084685]|uniref:protein kinase domain-containing protein n=1 Tax=Nocardia sp. CA-084685 TaxID=3239970 RepID=UPI003D980DA8
MPKLQPGQRRGKWTLTEAITKHVWHVTTDDDTAGVLKTPRNGYPTTLSRFCDEVEGLQSLAGVHGVLPVIDRDCETPARWFVMPPAQPLADHLATADFDVTVAAFAQLAAVLADLKNRPDPVAHRDIKPDNLFWFDGQPVFGDFGIAAWANSAGVTQDREKVGPIAFLAPEAMRAARVLNWHAADIYSLAKSLWALAAPRQIWPDHRITCEYPPPGQIKDSRYSLKHFGGPAARELDPVIQQATADLNGQRPTAAAFAEELRSWLRQHPGPHPRPPENGGPRLLGHGDIQLLLQEHTATANAFLWRLSTELRAALGYVELDDSVDDSPRGTRDADGTLKSAAIMDRHGRPPEDEWDGSLILRFQPPNADVRLIVGAVINSRTDMDLIAERHHRLPDGTWTLVFTDDLQSLHPAFPSTTEQLRQLITRLTADPKVPRTDQTWTGDRVL